MIFFFFFFFFYLLNFFFFFKKIIVGFILIVTIVGIETYKYVDSNKETMSDKSKEHIKSNDMLTMMLETEAGTGIYEEVIQSEWPQEGYVFNTELSKCENGGIVFWDDENKSVKMKSNISDKCYVYFDKYNKAELNVSVNKDDSSITVTVTSTDEITKYYYSKDGGSNYVESTNNTYTFTNLDNDTSYQIKIYGIDSNGQTTKEYNETIKTDDILTLVNYITSTVYTTDGANGLYYHDGVGTYTNANQEAGDNSYRYSGANPNNYVCFGSDAATCPNDNLYRIIGLFDDDKDGIYNIKLIKNSSIGKYAWDSGRRNTWNKTEKPDIYTTLNTTYWNALSSKWQGLIDNTHQWQVGGMAWSSTNTVKLYYDVEIKNQTGYEEPMAIGLMYVSDYGYATSPENWKTALFKYNNTTNNNNNWLYLRSYEWTNSHRSDHANNVFFVYSAINCDYADGAYAVRPSFYLKPEVVLESGAGSADDPYRINL